MQKIFIILVLFCILKFNVDVEGRIASQCDLSACKERCEKQNKNGKCVIETEMDLVYRLCKCY
uniref:U10-buthitoxin-Hj1a n=1 Tax=Hottentotta judaicus TaxID=6863 RepID=KA23H_HOTJU|nr:RecName: Full=U10-buthitoxin-Hj1a; Short=U10-BUTX-Hj1a; Flags: Precursor [Hottentotta judaicus]ADY39520.1 U10-buthitoxin-Hj1a [Hottentotta judaicus]